MAVQIVPVGLLRPLFPAESLALDQWAGHSTEQILTELGIAPDMVAMVLVNGRQVRKDALLRDGDVVKLIPLVGGG